MIKNNYKWLLIPILMVFVACDSDDDSAGAEVEVVALTDGEADFSNYVAVGNSLTAGFTDNALFIAAQQNSLPNILSSKFELAGGGEFTQPLMHDNIGGLIMGSTVIQPPRLYFYNDPSNSANSRPMVLGTDPDDDTPEMPTTEASTVLEGPFNNMGVPGAKSFHLLSNSYGNPAGLLTDPPTSNPYYVRMASTTDATILGDAVVQVPTFFTLWIGANDVLSYAISGGVGVYQEGNGNPGTYDPDDITDSNVFTGTYKSLVQALTSGGAKGVVANIPDIKVLPHFTTVPYAPLDPENEGFKPLIPTLNETFGQLNQVFTALGVPERSIVFETDAASAVVVKDESLTDLSSQISAALQGGGLDPNTATIYGTLYGQARQANENDLLVLPSSSIIGQVNADAYAMLTGMGVPAETAGQLSVNGVTFPLEDKWVLTPEEQENIATATGLYNATIKQVAEDNNLAFVDAHNIMNLVAASGYGSHGFILEANLATGGAFSLDGVHPTARGNALLANEFLKAIDVQYGSNFEASGNLADLGNYPVMYSTQLP